MVEFQLLIHIKHLKLIDMVKHKCECCQIKAMYDAKPTSLVGRLWKWHINFCPGWKAYFMSLSKEEKDEIRIRYSFSKYRQE